MCMQDIKKCTWPEPSTNIIEKYYTCSSRRPSSNDYQSLLLLRKNTIAVATFLSFLQKNVLRIFKIRICKGDNGQRKNSRILTTTAKCVAKLFLQDLLKKEKKL